MNSVFNKIAKSGLIAPVSAGTEQQISALSKSGIFCAEVNFLLPFVKKTVWEICARCPQILLGIGTISDEENLKKAQSAGVSFYTVSADLFLKAKNDCKNLIPVCTTPEEVKRVVNGGCSFLQVSAETAKTASLFSTYKEVRFIVSGADDISAYAVLPQVAAVKLNTTGNAAVYSRAMEALLGYDLRHVGINCDNAEESAAVAEQFEMLFGFPKEDRGGAYFAGNVIEVMKKQFYGKHGHIAIITNSAERAAYYLEKKGVALNWQSAGYNPDGSLRVVYLQNEVGGFALHILQK